MDSIEPAVTEKIPQYDPTKLLKSAKRTARVSLLRGIGWFAAAVVATALSYTFANSGMSYAVFTGGMLYGGYELIRGIHLIIDPYFLLERQLGSVAFESVFGERPKSRRVFGGIVVGILVLLGIGGYFAYRQFMNYSDALDAKSAQITAAGKQDDACNAGLTAATQQLDSIRAQITDAQVKNETPLVQQLGLKAGDLAKDQQQETGQCSDLKDKYNKLVDEYNAM